MIRLSFRLRCNVTIYNKVSLTNWTRQNCLMLRLLIYVDNEKIVTWHYNKRDEFNFSRVNFLFLSCNPPSAAAYTALSFITVQYARESVPTIKALMTVLHPLNGFIVFSGSIGKFILKKVHP